MTSHPTINIRAFISRAAWLGILVDGDGRRSIEEVIERGASRTNDFTGPRSRDYEKAFEVLSSAAITAAVADNHARAFGRAHLKAALKWICPLFPFCE